MPSWGPDLVNKLILFYSIHRDDLEVYWKRQKRTYRSPHPAKTSSKSYAKCSRRQASTCKDFWLISITFLTVAAGKNLINC